LKETHKVGTTPALQKDPQGWDEKGAAKRKGRSGKGEQTPSGQFLRENEQDLEGKDVNEMTSGRGGGAGGNAL
jgi:hypothetical protein